MPGFTVPGLTMPGLTVPGTGGPPFKNQEVALPHNFTLHMPPQPWTYKFHAFGLRVRGDTAGPVANRVETTAT